MKICSLFTDLYTKNKFVTIRTKQQTTVYLQHTTYYQIARQATEYIIS
jgi:hypothetical protein